jgi:hypothetical protein
MACFAIRWRRLASSYLPIREEWEDKNDYSECFSYCLVAYSSAILATGLFPCGNLDWATNEKSQPPLCEAGRLFGKRV